MRPQGWYFDPCGVHGERWFPGGRPARLVRDTGIVAHDAPPPGEPATPPVPVTPRPAYGGDLKRADAATRKDQSYDGRKAFFAVVEGILGQGNIQ